VIDVGSGQKTGSGGTSNPREVVVTETEAVPLPFAKLFGVTEQEVAAAGTAQLRDTAEEKPFCAAIEIALLNVAVAPAETVTLVVPLAAIEKSGGPVAVTVNGADVPAGEGSTTKIG
jgi:hypothetical protein